MATEGQKHARQRDQVEIGTVSVTPTRTSVYSVLPSRIIQNDFLIPVPEKTSPNKLFEKLSHGVDEFLYLEGWLERIVQKDRHLASA